MADKIDESRIYENLPSLNIAPSVIGVGSGSGAALRNDFYTYDAWCKNHQGVEHASVVVKKGDH